MSLLEIREGVGWQEPGQTWLYGYMFWDPDEGQRVAHRKCWDGLSNTKRKQIRHRADEAPMSMGRTV